MSKRVYFRGIGIYYKKDTRNKWIIPHYFKAYVWMNIIKDMFKE